MIALRGEFLIGAARVATWVTVFGIPVVILRSTYDPFDTPKLALLLIGTGVALGLLLATKETNTSALRALTLPALAVAFPISLAWIASEQQAWSFLGEYSRYQGWLPTIATVLLGLVAAVVFQGRAELLAGAMVAAASVVAAYALIQLLGLDPLEWFESAYVASTMGHSNFAGGFLAMGLPLALGVWSKQGPWSALGRVATVLIGVALIGTFSQGAWAAAVAAVAIFGTFSLRHRWKRAATVGAGVAIAIALAVFTSVIAAQTLLELQLAGSSIWTRGLHWGTAVSVAAEHPLTGAGPNTFSFEAASHRSPAEILISGRADDPHSVPLAGLANHGVLGLAGFVLLVAWVMGAGYNHARDPVAIGFLAAAVAYLVQALVTVDELGLRATFWAILAGLAIVGANQADGAGQPRPKRSGALLVGGLLGTIAFTYLGVGLVIADQHAARAVTAVRRGSLDLAEKEFARSAAGVGGHPEHRQIVGSELGRAAAERQHLGRPFIDAMRAIFEPVLDFPSAEWRGAFAYWLSQWSAVDDSVIGEALGAWRRVRILDPSDPRIAIQRADLLIQANQPERAVAELEVFERLMLAPPPGTRGLPEFWGALAVARVVTGDDRGALLAYEEGRSLDGGACRVAIAEELLEERGILGRHGSRPGLLVALNCDPAAAALLQTR